MSKSIFELSELIRISRKNTQTSLWIAREVLGLNIIALNIAAEKLDQFFSLIDEGDINNYSPDQIDELIEKSEGKVTDLSEYAMREADKDV